LATNEHVKQSCLFLLLLLAQAVPLRGADPGAIVLGGRSGFSATSFDDPFLQTELYLARDLPSRRPWRLESKSGWLCQTRLDVSAGWLSGQGEDSFVGTFGPAFLAGNERFPLFLDGGTSVTYLSRFRFGPTDFGVPLQFTTHLGLQLHLTSRINVGYRLAHMSNAGQSRKNPGLDLHFFGMDYRF
jgi:hypothetical protein